MEKLVINTSEFTEKSSEQLAVLLGWLPRSARLQLGSLSHSLPSVRRICESKPAIAKWLEQLTTSDVRTEPARRSLVAKFERVWPSSEMHVWVELFSAFEAWANESLRRREIGNLEVTLRKRLGRDRQSICDA